MKVCFLKRRPEQKRSARGATCLLAIAGCALGVGCHKTPTVSQEEQVQTALNRFYAAQPVCLWDKPVALTRLKHTPNFIGAKEARALDDAGLIDKERHGYSVTNAGMPFWREEKAEPGSGNLCFGKWNVTRIDSMKPRKDDLFGNTTETEFQANIPSPALWTRLPEVQKAFPVMAMKVTEPMPHSATMRHTDKGWQVAVIAVP